MTYRTKRPRLRTILAFGAGATLAMTQLGAGCVPANRYRNPDDADADRAPDVDSDAGDDAGEK